MVATGGDSALGGDDIDAALADWALTRAGRRGPRRRRATSPRSMPRAQPRRRCRRARARDFACAVAGAGERSSSSAPSSKPIAAALRRPHARRRPPGAARCQGREGRRSTASSWSAARPGCRWCSARSRAFRQRAAHRPRPRPGRRARRRHPGRSARRQRRRPTTAAARRDPAVARARDHGRAGRAHHSAQQPDPDGARTGLHHLPGRPDRDGDPRRAGRARAGRRLPLAGALRAARHPADGRRRGAHPGHVHGRRRRPARRRARARRRPASRPRSPSSRATACATTKLRGC